MKSSDMLRALKEANQNDAPIPTSLLEFFISNGNFAVHTIVHNMIASHRPVVGQLPINIRMGFLLAYLEESFRRDKSYDLSSNTRAFLYEIYNYNLDAEKRHKYLQQFIDLVQELRAFAPEKRDYFSVTVSDALVRYFPEVADRRKYHCSDEFAAWIQESYSVYFPRG